MKITKIRLKEIIREEMGSIHSRLKREGHSTMEPSPSTGLGNLWRDLNILLERWPDKEHPYYIDLHNLLEDYSTSPDRPTRLAAPPDIEEGKKTKVTKPGQDRVSKKIGHLIGKEKKDKDQAAAIAYSMEKRGELKKGGKHSVE